MRFVSVLVIAPLTLLACGGSVSTPAPPDAAQEADTQSDAAPDAGPEAGPCTCLPDALYCNGVRTDDALSCATCGYPCTSTPDAAAE